MDLLSSCVQSFLGPLLIVHSACTTTVEEVETEDEEEECCRRIECLSWRVRIERTENMFD